MASGSSGRNNSASKGFDFASDDILCSYEDYGSQENPNGSHSDPAIGPNSSKEFHKSRMAKSSLFPNSSYSPPEEYLNQDVISTVDKTMKKYSDNLMRFLEGISSRLSQLELYCYNLDKSIGEMRSDLVRDHGEADSKLKSLEKHLQEVHRSVQILRDKQELAETQKELAKLQLAQKGSTSSNHSQQNEERGSPQSSDSKKTDNTNTNTNTAEVNNQQLALALPHQVAPQQQQQQQPLLQHPSVGPHPPVPPQNVTQPQAYYLPPNQMQNPPPPSQPSQGQYLPPSDSQYRPPQLQDMSRVAPQPTQSQMNQPQQIHPLPQYQQQWPQQLPQQVQPPPQQPSMQPQARPPPSAGGYPSYLTSQPANPSPQDSLPNNMQLQMPLSGMSQPGAIRGEAMSYGYAGTGRPVPVPPQQPPQQQQHKPTFDGYTSGPHPSLSQGNSYMMYEGEGVRTHHQPPQLHFSQGGYAPTNVPFNSQPNAGSGNIMARPPQFMRNHAYSDLTDKLVNMGYRSDHVVAVIQRMEESGQPVDFNSVLDRLNGNSSGGPQRGWSG